MCAVVKNICNERSSVSFFAFLPLVVALGETMTETTMTTLSCHRPSPSPFASPSLSPPSPSLPPCPGRKLLKCDSTCACAHRIAMKRTASSPGTSCFQNACSGAQQPAADAVEKANMLVRWRLILSLRRDVRSVADAGLCEQKNISSVEVFCYVFC